mmetsp:Transcript_123978/g.277095  ORF Transcript_123978/g.277095 Transcript_123978/m.277095 type:complete len:290 (+) Transcript_123978:836-1705(+)
MPPGGLVPNAAGINTGGVRVPVEVEASTGPGTLASGVGSGFGGSGASTTAGYPGGGSTYTMPELVCRVTPITEPALAGLKATQGGTETLPSPRGGANITGKCVTCGVCQALPGGCEPGRPMVMTTWRLPGPCMSWRLALPATTWVTPLCAEEESEGSEGSAAEPAWGVAAPLLAEGVAGGGATAVRAGALALAAACWLSALAAACWLSALAAAWLPRLGPASAAWVASRVRSFTFSSARAVMRRFKPSTDRRNSTQSPATVALRRRSPAALSAKAVSGAVEPGLAPALR